MSSFDSTISSEINELRKNLMDKFKNSVFQLQSELETMTPVDTGFLRSSWNEPIQTSNYSFHLSNDASYAYYLLVLGRHFDGNKFVGSNQLPDGVLPHIRNWAKEIGG
jgi:hypothetical protein